MIFKVAVVWIALSLPLGVLIGTCMKGTSE